MASFDASHFGIPLVFEGEKTTVPIFFETNTEGQVSASSFHKRTGIVWNNFEKVIVDEDLKVKCKKICQIICCASSREIDHWKRFQESHMMSDARLQSILNTQEDNLVGNFAYNYENKKKILIK